MTTANLPVVAERPSVELGVVSASTPRDMVARATEAAHALSEVIEDRKLFNVISGRKFVKCEGWTTLAAMMGCTPREVSMEDHEGTYVATVELVRLTDGQVLTRASAECGMDESTWKGRANYARRSMAATRATSKACRLAFSWVMALTGFEVTPSEEMSDADHVAPPRAPAPRPEPIPAGVLSETAKQIIPSMDEMPKPLQGKPEVMPWEDEQSPWAPDSPVRDTIPFPHGPEPRGGERIPLAVMTRNQLRFVIALMADKPELANAAEWKQAAEYVLRQRFGK